MIVLIFHTPKEDLDRDPIVDKLSKMEQHIDNRLLYRPFNVIVQTV